jgi:carbonic anhydrase/acetyltransferase-like protein (isoleucine patch superfamily)
MSASRPALEARDASDVNVASTATVLGVVWMGKHSAFAQGAAVRAVSAEGAVRIGSMSYVLENSVVVGRPDLVTTIGHKTVFGHRCTIVGATVGDLCEVGNGSTLMPGAHLGNRVFLGERTLVPAGMHLPDDVVAVGNPAHIVRVASADDRARLLRLRDGDLALPTDTSLTEFTGHQEVGSSMGQLYAYRDKFPIVAPTARVFDSAEITGDVVIGEGSIIGAGVRIIGDSHGPVRIGERVQILENSVLHLLPDNELVLEDDVIIGPAAMIHGCHIGARTVVEPAATVCDWSSIGADSIVRAGAVVKQRATFGDRAVIDGFPAQQVESLDASPPVPAWAFHPGDLETLQRR